MKDAKTEKIEQTKTHKKYHKNTQNDNHNEAH